MGEIIFKMNDANTKKKYRRRELLLAIFYGIIVILDLGAPWYSDWYVALAYVEIIFVLNVICFIVLMHQLKYYHRYEYVKNKKNLFLVFAFTVFYHYLYVANGFFRDSLDR